MYQHATRTRGWFSEILTVEDTAALSHEAIAEALSEYQSLYGLDAGSAMFEQEMMCSFTAALLGTFIHGFRLDLSAAAYLSLVPFLLVALSAVRGFTKAAGRLVPPAPRAFPLGREHRRSALHSLRQQVEREIGRAR